jgi:hypothetical protein
MTQPESEPKHPVVRVFDELADAIFPCVGKLDLALERLNADQPPEGDHLEAGEDRVTKRSDPERRR